MALIFADEAAQRLKKEVTSLTVSVLAVTDDYVGGDMPLDLLNAVQRAFERASGAASDFQMQVDTHVAQETAAGVTPDMSIFTDALKAANFPPDLSVFSAGVITLGDKAAAWNAETGPRRAAAIPANGLITTTRKYNSVTPGRTIDVTTKQETSPRHLPEAEGLAIKNSIAAQELRQALVDLKAI